MVSTSIRVLELCLSIIVAAAALGDVRGPRGGARARSELAAATPMRRELMRRSPPGEALLQQASTPDSRVHSAHEWFYNLDEDTCTTYVENTSWTEFIEVGSSPCRGFPINQVKCRDPDCAQMSLHYSDLPLDRKTGAWTANFSQSLSGEGICPPRHLATRIRIHSDRAHNRWRMQLFCQAADEQYWLIDEDTTEEMQWFNSYTPESHCSSGFVLYGVKCMYNNCGDKKLLCKQVRDTTANCRWLPWADWSPCYGTCTEAKKTRHRSKKREDDGGDPCRGPHEEAVYCEMQDEGCKDEREGKPYAP